MKKIFNKKISPSAIMLIGFLSIILIGAFLLTTPLASNSGKSTNFIDCLFTATSAVCVTGLVVVDTSLYWSLFGKIVIISLIQIGGLGFMTIGSIIGIILGKKINLRQRVLIKESMNQETLSGLVRLVMHVIKYTFIIELTGALLLMTVFIPEFGIKKGIFFGIFHSISAFCNAGFDLLGSTSGAFASLTDYYSNPIVVFTISGLIILGGIGFAVMVCVKTKKSFKKYDLTSKLVLTTTLLLISIGTILIFINEYDNPATLGNMNLFDKLQNSFFQSVTTRTAGFGTVDFASMHESTLFFIVFLMFIGASPASTGGGIKTTTLAVIFLTVKSFLKNEKEITVYKRRLSEYAFKKAIGIFFIAISIVFTGTFFILITQGPNFSLIESMFEVSSAFATVGLSIGGTPNLNTAGKIIIILLMYMGRVGSLTVFSIIVHESKIKNIRFPKEKIIIG